MKRILISKHGGPDVLQLVESELPEPQLGEARIKVLAAGVSYPDILIREGLYPDPNVPPPPFTPGYDVVGVVDALGQGVTSIRAGQTVAAMTLVGGYAEYLCVPEKHLVPVPEGVDPAEAVCLALNYLTAYQTLERSLRLKSGQRILVHGAAGGVGTALLQLGQLKGLEMYGTASAPKHDLVRELGGIPIDYKREDFVARIRQLTKGEGVDAVVDHFMGTHLWQSYRALRRGGVLVGIGMSNTVGKRRLEIVALGGWTALLFLLMTALPDGRKPRMYSVTRFRDKHPELHREDMMALFQYLCERKIRPVIAERMPLKDAARAHELLGNAAIGGRIVLVPD